MPRNVASITILYRPNGEEDIVSTARRLANHVNGMVVEADTADSMSDVIGFEDFESNGHAYA